MDLELTPRQEKLLGTIVSSFIQTAEPVSSKLLEKEGDFDLCSASIRNEMGELEHKGYLEQRHTSGGRIPTDKAYRFFVDKLVKTHELDPSNPLKKKIDQRIRTAGQDPREVSKLISVMLSDMLDQLVITGMKESNDFYKTGLSGLLGFPEFREFDRMCQLTSFFDKFENIFQEMERDFFEEQSDFPQVVIGRENTVKNTWNETMIMATYSLPDGRIGTVTLVGPTRMDYEKNIGVIKYLVETLNKTF